MPAATLKREVEEVIIEQIEVFRQLGKLNGGELFEYHLRHFKIMELYLKIDRVASAGMLA